MGSDVKNLETRLAEQVGVNFCVTCGNGTDALRLVLQAWQVGPGDAVFIPDFTFFATAEAVCQVGATPVIVDVGADSFNLSAASLALCIEKTKQETNLVPKVVIPVDLFGRPADYHGIREIAHRDHLRILEDAAQGFGATFGDSSACALGDAGTTSFFPAKPLGCYGDGGAIFTDNEQTASILRSLRVHGKGSDKYDNIRIGTNSRLDTLQAAILMVKLDIFVVEMEKRQALAAQYTKALSGLPGLKCPDRIQNGRSAWAQYTITAESTELRNRCMKSLAENDIPSIIYYRTPMHAQPALKDLAFVPIRCDTSKYLSERVFSIPFHPYLDEEDIQRVASVLQNAVS